MPAEALLIFLLVVALAICKPVIYEINRRRRRDYYRDVYLKSDAWARKRFVVLRRDNWQCVYCGEWATQVHHLKYAKWQIGKESIDWLVSVCKHCHEDIHH